MEAIVDVISALVRAGGVPEDNRQHLSLGAYGLPLLVELRHGFEQYIPHHLKALRAEFVEGVLGGMPVGGSAVVVINQVHGRNPDREKR